MGVPVRGMGVAPHLSSSKMWVTSHPRVISLVFFVGTITLLHPQNPYQITYSLMMLLIKLCCLVSSFLMSHIALAQPSVRFIVYPSISNLSLWVISCDRRMSIESRLLVCTSKVLLGKNNLPPISLILPHRSQSR